MEVAHYAVKVDAHKEFCGCIQRNPRAEALFQVDNLSRKKSCLDNDFFCRYAPDVYVLVQ